MSTATHLRRLMSNTAASQDALRDIVLPLSDHPGGVVINLIYGCR